VLELECEARAKSEQNEHNFIAYIDGLLVYISQFKRAASDLLGKLSARRRDHSARQHAPFPLGQIRGVRHASNRDGAAWTGVPQRERRSAKKQVVGGVLNSFRGLQETNASDGMKPESRWAGESPLSREAGGRPRKRENVTAKGKRQ